MAIAVLGQLTVDGDATVLGPRDRVVLAALAIRAGEAVSAEGLADALWGDQPPDSWTKVVQGCVVRLRKVLGPEAIQTVPHGYRLAVPADEIDAHRFERLLGRSRELLTLDEPERAAYVAGEALDLWRGRPLVELEGWDAGRIEAQRLDELRLEAQEVHLDAALRAGRYSEVLGEAQARVAEAPLRERRWALLATAQYQAGQQGDALRTLYRARAALRAEAGLDPGPELVALEQAILQQDPALVPAGAPPASSASCPYLGLVPYDVGDADGFFGREEDVTACLRRLSQAGVLVVVGPSGSGKSSLVRAGVAAALRREGHRVVVVTPGPHPMDVFTGEASVLGSAALVIDQGEEAVTLGATADEQAAFAAAVVARAETGPVILAVRADRLGELASDTVFARLVERGLYLLSPMGDAGLRAAIEGPARQSGWLLEPGLVDLLVREVEGEPGALPLLSHALRRTWECREGRTLTVAGYRSTGGVRGAVAESAEDVYGRIPAEQQPVLRDLLLRLVMPAADGEPVRARVPRRLVVTRPEHVRLIELLVAARLVTSDDGVVEIAHEALARAWPRLRSWLDDDVEGQRILRHLTMTADSWETMGRPESELYRGTRLAQAVEWKERAAPDLTAAEQLFLDGSEALADAERGAAEERARHQVRVNRRLRSLLVAVAATLVIALTAGTIAVVQSRRVADQQEAAARVAEAVARRAISAQSSSLRASRRDVAALLALESYRLDPGAASRSALFGTFTHDPAFRASISVPDAEGELSSAVVLPGNQRALAADWDGRVHVLDLERGVDTGERFATPEFFFGETRLALSRDGMLLAEISAGRGEAFEGRSWLVLYDVETGEFRVPPRHTPANVGDVAISPDGNWVVTAGGSRAETFVHRADTGEVVLTIPGPARPPSLLNYNTAAVAFADDGRLFVAYEAGPVRIFAAPAFHEIGQLPAPAEGGGTPLQLVISSDQRTLVGISEFGTIAAWDLETGDVRWSDVATICSSIVLGPAPSGPVYCGLEEPFVAVLDLQTGAELRAPFDTQGGIVHSLAITPDGSELLSLNAVGPIAVWAIDGGGAITRAIRGEEQPISYSPDGQLLLAWQIIESGAQLRIFDLASGTNDELDGIRSALWGPDPGQLVALAADSSAGLYDVARHELTLAFPPADRDAVTLGAAVDVENNRVFVWRSTGGVFLDLDTGEPAGPNLEFPSATLDAAFSRGGTRLAVLDEVAGVTVYDAMNGTKVGAIPVRSAAVAYAPDGRLVVASPGPGRRLAPRRDAGPPAGAGVLSFYDGTTLEKVATDVPIAHGSVTSIEFSTDGSVLKASSRGGVSLFDGATGAPLGDPINSRNLTDWAIGALRPDGREVAVSAAGGIALWDLDPERWIDAACRVAGRNLTLEEWETYIGSLAPYHQTCAAFG